MMVCHWVFFLSYVVTSCVRRCARGSALQYMTACGWFQLDYFSLHIGFGCTIYHAVNILARQLPFNPGVLGTDTPLLHLTLTLSAEVTLQSQTLKKRVKTGMNIFILDLFLKVRMNWRECLNTCTAMATSKLNMQMRSLQNNQKLQRNVGLTLRRFLLLLVSRSVENIMHIYVDVVT